MLQEAAKRTEAVATRIAGSKVEPQRTGQASDFMLCTDLHT